MIQKGTKRARNDQETVDVLERNVPCIDFDHPLKQEQPQELNDESSRRPFRRRMKRRCSKVGRMFFTANTLTSINEEPNLLSDNERDSPLTIPAEAPLKIPTRTRAQDNYDLDWGLNKTRKVSVPQDADAMADLILLMKQKSAVEELLRTLLVNV